MAENGTQITLSTRQQRGLAALVGGAKSVREAASVSKIGERTLWRWLADPTFRAALAAWEAECLSTATRRLLSMQEAALNTFEQTLADTEARQELKVRAAALVLDFCLRLREVTSLEERLQALEEKIR